MRTSEIRSMLAELRSRLRAVEGAIEALERLAAAPRPKVIEIPRSDRDAA